KISITSNKYYPQEFHVDTFKDFSIKRKENMIYFTNLTFDGDFNWSDLNAIPDRQIINKNISEKKYIIVNKVLRQNGSDYYLNTPGIFEFTIKLQKLKNVYNQPQIEGSIIGTKDYIWSKKGPNNTGGLHVRMSKPNYYPLDFPIKYDLPFTWDDEVRYLLSNSIYNSLIEVTNNNSKTFYATLTGLQNFEIDFSIDIIDVDPDYLKNFIFLLFYKRGTGNTFGNTNDDHFLVFHRDGRVFSEGSTFFNDYGYNTYNVKVVCKALNAFEADFSVEIAGYTKTIRRQYYDNNIGKFLIIMGNIKNTSKIYNVIWKIADKIEKFDFENSTSDNFNTPRNSNNQYITSNKLDNLFNNVGLIKEKNIFYRIKAIYEANEKLYAWILILSLVIGIITNLVAIRKNRNQYAWFFIGFFFGLIGLIASLIVPKLHINSKNKYSNASNNVFEKKCPDCAEIIKAEAKMCRFCGRIFSETELQEATNSNRN
ncbi:MAG: zinc ribbon domain-containing protein, partial [Bacteroidetes bacterium]|nr:zinc ribbon domain-containing protein [Bacteroidota bacterium]